MTAEELTIDWGACNANGRSSWYALCKKYPEFKTSYHFETYIQKQLAAAVPELLLTYMHEVHNHNAYWCYDCTLDQLKQIVLNRIFCAVVLRRKALPPHSYIVSECSQIGNRNRVVLIDNSKFWKPLIGASQPIKESMDFDNFLTRVKGNPIFISGLTNDREMATLRKILKGSRLYRL